MRVRIRELLHRPLGRLLVIMAVLSLTPPSSATVLCIAPGSHVAIEEFNAGCCRSSTLSVRGAIDSEDTLDAFDDCQDCVDFVLAAADCGPIPEFYVFTAAAPADGCFNRALSAPASSIRYPGAIPSGAVLSAVLFSAMPLRC